MISLMFQGHLIIGMCSEHVHGVCSIVCAYLISSFKYFCFELVF